MANTETDKKSTGTKKNGGKKVPQSEIKIDPESSETAVEESGPSTWSRFKTKCARFRRNVKYGYASSQIACGENTITSGKSKMVSLEGGTKDEVANYKRIQREATRDAKVARDDTFAKSDATPMRDKIADIRTTTAKHLEAVAAAKEATAKAREAEAELLNAVTA